MDSTGKINFDHIYTEPDPRAFFGTLRRLDYDIPQQAKAYFAKLIDEYRAEADVKVPTVLDLGCSYGVNAALHRFDTTMERLYDHYASAGSLSRDELIARDRRMDAVGDGVRFIGLDASAPALDYALAAGFIDEAIHADLENEDPTEEQRALLADVDIVISTGCVGYVTEKTLVRIARENRPWMAHFVLRMFSYGPVADSLGDLEYETTGVEGVFRQRKFASAEEQTQILDNLSVAGVDPRGLEDGGRLYARLFVSRPNGAAGGLASALNALPLRDQG
ncbi:class I SAM-dependent methyltransferase [Amycolatopsis sp. EV170708-02-1]|uniref:class I SAM-dependent methyltransferase n=1 Tax=Amycolatopsis sp. EV170708-02-1 TaxID=2919322 RepID=UPI001F0C3626|nr:class I SAM-dependent methyltransferase [Amycolatopsis sp. EV170708-02-1]UMP07598.1 class I SAM-dependent methyltransferase [Amycolatopsis sp. EV170708-02-1]